MTSEFLKEKKRKHNTKYVENDTNMKNLDRERKTAKTIPLLFFNTQSRNEKFDRLRVPNSPSS